MSIQNNFDHAKIFLLILFILAIIVVLIGISRTQEIEVKEGKMDSDQPYGFPAGFRTLSDNNNIDFMYYNYFSNKIVYYTNQELSDRNACYLIPQHPIALDTYKWYRKHKKYDIQKSIRLTRKYWKLNLKEESKSESFNFNDFMHESKDCIYGGQSAIYDSIIGSDSVTNVITIERFEK